MDTSPDILASHVTGHIPAVSMGADGAALLNPLSGMYATSDDRYIILGMPQADRCWPGFCRTLDREDLIDDPNCNSLDKRAHNEELFKIIRETFASKPLSY